MAANTSPPSYDEWHHTTINPSRSSSDHLSPYTEIEPSQQDPKLPLKSSKPKKRRCEVDLSDSWTWEIGSAVLSVVGIALLVGFLISIHTHDSYTDWQYTVSPNTIIAIISAVTKASLLGVVSACLGQLKWRLYERSSSAPLERMQTVDEASRGSWGAMKVLWRVVSGSKMGILTLSGAFLTFLAVAVDPFAQQILSFPSREVQATNETAFIQSAHNYTWDLFTNYYDAVPDSQLKAINRGLSLPDTGLQAECTVAKCSYPSFVSLGICSKCEDVTKRTTQVCRETVKVLLDDSPMNDISCTYTAPYDYNITLSFIDDIKKGAMVYNESYKNFSLDFFQSYPRGLGWNEYFVKEGNEIFDLKAPILSILTANQRGYVIYTSQNNTAWPPKPSFTECAMYWCEKEYAPSNFSATSDPTPISRTQELILDKTSGLKWNLDIFNPVPPPGLTTLSNKSSESSSTYQITGNVALGLSWQLGTIFNQSQAADMYHIQVANNVTDVVKSLSTSLTDTMRSADVSNRIPGTAFKTETYIHVRWPWIILPCFVVLASNILLLATTLATRNTVLWKNSLLPLLRSYFHSTSTAPEDSSIPLRNVDGRE